MIFDLKVSYTTSAGERIEYQFGTNFKFFSENGDLYYKVIRTAPKDILSIRKQIEDLVEGLLESS